AAAVAFRPPLSASVSTGPHPELTAGGPDPHPTRAPQRTRSPRLTPTPLPRVNPAAVCLPTPRPAAEPPVAPVSSAEAVEHDRDHMPAVRSSLWWDQTRETGVRNARACHELRVTWRKAVERMTYVIAQPCVDVKD